SVRTARPPPHSPLFPYTTLFRSPQAATTSDRTPTSNVSFLIVGCLLGAGGKIRADGRGAVRRPTSPVTAGSRGVAYEGDGVTRQEEELCAVLQSTLSSTWASSTTGWGGSPDPSRRTATS